MSDLRPQTSQANLPRAKVVRLSVLLFAAFGLAACSWFGDDEPKPVSGVSQQGRAAAQAANDGGAPSLGSVPARPATTSASDRRALQQGLQGDRDQARYTEDQLRGRGASAAPATVPPPPSAATAAVAAPPPPSPVASAPPLPQRPPVPQPAYGSYPQPPQGIPAYPGQEQVAQVYAQQLQASAATSLGQASGGVPGGAGSLYSQQVATIIFSDGSTQLSAGDRQILQAVATEQRRSGGSIRVVGHASSDRLGGGLGQPTQANYDISVKRAEAIATALVSMGAPRDQVFYEGRAETQPVYQETSSRAAAYNRRAEIFLER